MSYFPTLLNWAERTDSKKIKQSWKEKSWIFSKPQDEKVSPEIYFAVDDDQEEKRENAVYDQVGVGEVNLIYKIESSLPKPIVMLI